MTDIQNKDNRHYHAHKHTHTEQTALHSTKFVIFSIGNIDFQRSRDGFIFFEKYHNFTYVSSGMYLMTICGKKCNKDYVIRRDRQNITSESTPSGPLTSYVLSATR